MCTALNFKSVFGRTFDYERSFGEQIIITPREKVIYGMAKNQYATLGVGVVKEGRSLYFDGINEHGLCGAALNFPGCACYLESEGEGVSVASGAFLGFILGFCKDIHSVRDTLANIFIYKQNGDTPLHWIFADGEEAITVESVKDGLKIYDNPLGVLANSPEFPHHLANLANYLHLSNSDPGDNLTDGYISVHSRGLGGIGLPGDFSSRSRFVRALFLKKNSLIERSTDCGSDERSDDTNTDCEELSEAERFFHVSSSLSIPLGSVLTKEGLPVSTRYTACAHKESLSYYFTSYRSRQICRVRLTDEESNQKEFVIYPLYPSENIRKLN